MNSATKDAIAVWPDSMRLRVRVTWTWPCDIDLAAVLCDSEGSDVVYHRNPGLLGQRPYIHLESDAGESARSKDRFEDLVITRMPKEDGCIGIAVWDHDAVIEGRDSALLVNPESFALEIQDEYNRRLEMRCCELESANGAILCQLAQSEAGLAIRTLGKGLRMDVETRLKPFLEQQMVDQHATE